MKKKLLGNIFPLIGFTQCDLDFLNHKIIYFQLFISGVYLMFDVYILVLYVISI